MSLVKIYDQIADNIVQNYRTQNITILSICTGSGIHEKEIYDRINTKYKTIVIHFYDILFTPDNLTSTKLHKWKYDFDNAKITVNNFITNCYKII